MAKEIERKFLVTDSSYRTMAKKSLPILQGYISRRREGTVRVRIKGNEAFITIKGITEGIVRNEWEDPWRKRDIMSTSRATPGKWMNSAEDSPRWSWRKLRCPTPMPAQSCPPLSAAK